MLHNPTVEDCKSVSNTFYTDIGSHSVFVTITVQELPEKIKLEKGSHKNISEYLGYLAEVFSQKDIAEKFTNP